VYFLITYRINCSWAPSRKKNRLQVTPTRVKHVILTAFACVVVGSQLFGIDCAVISSFSSIIAAANSNASVFFTLACFEQLWDSNKK